MKPKRISLKNKTRIGKFFRQFPAFQKDIRRIFLRKKSNYKIKF